MMALEPIDISVQFAPECEMPNCDHPAELIAKGCSDKHPVLMCEDCFNHGIELIKSMVNGYQRLNKQVMICGDCHRPILRLDTHIDVKKLST